MSGRCLEDIWNASRWYSECVRRVTGKSRDSVWRLYGRCLESVKIIISGRTILECSADSVSITFLGEKTPLGLAAVGR